MIIKQQRVVYASAENKLLGSPGYEKWRYCPFFNIFETVKELNLTALYLKRPKRLNIQINRFKRGFLIKGSSILFDLHDNSSYRQRRIQKVLKIFDEER